MLNVTQGQLKIFLIFLLFGIILSLVFLIISKTIKKTKFTALQVAFDILFSIITFFVFFILLLSLNYGELRLYIIISTILGIFLADKIFSIIVAKLFKKGYTTKEIQKE